MNNIQHEIINEIITDIYRKGLIEKTSKIDKDGQELFGYYLICPNKSYQEIKSLPQLERIFVNTKTKALKIYGQTMASDFENQFSEGLMYLYQAFYSVFSGQANVEKDLIVENIEDIHRIIGNERLASKLCRYCITYVDMCFRTYMKRYNVDYNYDGTNYTKINYFYLDEPNEDGTNRHEELGSTEDNIDIEEQIGEVAEYVMSNYFDNKLTNKQKLFVQCYLWFGQNKQGHIEDNFGNILYIKQEYQNYRKAIGAKLSKLIENDNHLRINEYGRFVLDWSEKENE